MGAISKICTVALAAGFMGVNAKPMEHEARDINLNNIFSEIAPNVRPADLINKISNEDVSKIAKEAVKTFPDLVNIGKEKVESMINTKGRPVYPFPPLSTGASVRLPKFPTTTGTSGRFPPKPVTTGTADLYRWPGKPISIMPVRLDDEQIASVLESDYCAQILADPIVNKQEKRYAGWETKCVPKIFSNYTGDEKTELENKFIEVAKKVPNKVGEPGYFDHLYRVESQIQSVVEVAKMNAKVPKDIVLNKIELIGSYTDSVSPPWKWDPSQHKPSNEKFPYDILDNTEVCIYQLSPNIGGGDKNKLKEYGNICLNAIFGAYDMKTRIELIKKTLGVVSSIHDLPKTAAAFNLVTQFEEMLQSIRAMAFSHMPEKQLMEKIEEFRPYNPTPAFTRRTDRAELTDSVILTISGMYKVADAIVKGDKKAVLAAMEPQNLFFYTTHSGADIAEMEKKIEELVLSIPSNTPLKAVQDRLATLTRTVLANSSPKADIMKKLNELAPLMSAGSASRSVARSATRVVRREEKEGDKITVSSSVAQPAAVNASQNAPPVPDFSADAPSSRLMHSAGALVLGSLAVTFLL